MNQQKYAVTYGRILLSAQRLSASQMNQHVRARTERKDRESCSTPFGISDESTFTHNLGTNTIVTRAQRLSASQMNQLNLWRGALVNTYVLNAFRHLR